MLKADGKAEEMPNKTTLVADLTRSESVYRLLSVIAHCQTSAIGASMRTQWPSGQERPGRSNGERASAVTWLRADGGPRCRGKVEPVALQHE